MNDNIKVTFVIRKDCRNENECSEEMQLAFVGCEQHRGGGLQAQWIREEEIRDLNRLTKRDVFVLNEFGGEIFEKLRNTKCLLVGPRCLSCCLTEGSPIPSGPEPVFTVAMRGLMVTASGLSKLQKETIKRKVQWMGGSYSPLLTDDTTHLVSDTVLSDKYVKSIEKGIPVMHESWVEAVWTKSLEQNINGSSDEFKQHTLPPFFNLQVTSSGIAKKEKQNITKLVNENGGTFTGAFQSETTDVVVLTKEGVGSEKYKAALEYGKACVLPAWIVDSVARGVALPLHKYRVAGASTSSPLAEHRLPDMSLNFSRITNLRAPSNFVDESRSVDISTISTKMKLSQDARKSTDTVDEQVQSAFEKLDMAAIKKAGPIFDGYCIWLCGPEGSWRERAAACISRCGGVRYSAAHARVTHLACADLAHAHSAAAHLPHAPALWATWLADCVTAGRLLDETQYLIQVSSPSPARRAAPEPSSPMSKKNLQLLRKEPLNLPPPQPTTEDIQPGQDEILNHYLSQSEMPRDKTPEPEVPAASATLPEVTQDEDESEEVEQIFKGLTFQIEGLDEEAVSEIEVTVRGAGGRAVRRGGDYVVAPLDAGEGGGAENLVTIFWLKDCLSQSELVPIMYYHRPVQMGSWDPENPPLKGVVASLSTYSGLERTFLDHLANVLGATTQLRFCRRTTPSSLASTHLICPTASGQKYLGAARWGLPAVTADWLMECAKQGARVPEKGFLVQPDGAQPSPVKEETSLQENQSKPAQESDQSTSMAQAKEVQSKSIEKNKEVTESMKMETNKENAMRPPVEMPRKTFYGSDTTPKQKFITTGGEVNTPNIEEALSSPNLRCFSPETRGRLRALKRGDVDAGAVKTPNDPFNKVPTPESGFGAGVCGGSGRLSPEARRRLWALVQRLPHKPTPEHTHTPLSEIRHRYLAQFNNEPTTPADKSSSLAPRKLHLQDDIDTPPAKMARHCVDQSPGTSSVPKQKNFTPNQTNRDSPKSHATIHNISAAAQVINRSETDRNTIGHHDKTDSSTANEINSAINAFNDGETMNVTKSANKSSSSVNKSSSSINKSSSSVNKSSSSVNKSAVNDNKSDLTGNKSKSGNDSALPAAVDAQLQRLSAALSGRNSSPAYRQRNRTRDVLPAPESEPAPESQPNTVGWDDTAPASRGEKTQTDDKPFANKRFMLSSNVDNREELISMIADLGGTVSESSEMDPEATHLMCAMPSRSEKMLGSIAAGKWILHPTYILECHRNGVALAEEQYEWGSPLASLPPLPPAELSLARAAHRWRSNREHARPPPFYGVVALIHAAPARRRLLASLVVAGGGKAPIMDPPYTDDSINVCFADVKRFPLSDRDAAWIKSHKIPVCAPVLLSSYLTDENTPDPRAHSLPDFKY